MCAHFPAPRSPPAAVRANKDRLQFPPVRLVRLNQAADLGVLVEFDQMLSSHRHIRRVQRGRIKAPMHGSFLRGLVESADAAAADNADIFDLTVTLEHKAKDHGTRPRSHKVRVVEWWRWLGSPLRMRRARSEERENGHDRNAGSLTRPTCYLRMLAHAFSLVISSSECNDIFYDKNGYPTLGGRAILIVHCLSHRANFELASWG